MNNMTTEEADRIARSVTLTSGLRETFSRITKEAWELDEPYCNDVAFLLMKIFGAFDNSVEFLNSRNEDTRNTAFSEEERVKLMDNVDSLWHLLRYIKKTRCSRGQRRRAETMEECVNIDQFVLNDIIREMTNNND